MAVHGQVDVAQLLVGVARLGEARLEGEDALGRLTRRLCLIAEVRELLGDVGDVRFAHLDRALVVARVVVALRQAEATLAHVDEVGVGVLEVRCDADVHQHADCERLQIARDRAHVCEAGRRRDAPEVRRERPGARRSDCGLVHGCGEVVAHHPVWGAVRVRVLGGVEQQAVEQLLVALGNLVKGTPRAVLGRDRVGVEPSAVRVSEEVLGRGHGVIEQGGVDRARRVGHEGSRGCECGQWSGSYPFLGQGGQRFASNVLAALYFTTSLIVLELLARRVESPPNVTRR